MRVSRTSAQCFCSSLRAQAKQSRFFRSQNHVKARAKTNWIASSQAFLAMTRQQSPGLLQALATPEKMIVQMKLVITTHRRCRAASCAVHRPFKPNLLDA
jgi:hypothetical protein